MDSGSKRDDLLRTGKDNILSQKMIALKTRRHVTIVEFKMLIKLIR